LPWGALEFLDLAPGLRGRLVAAAEVVFKRSRARQVAADDRVNVGQFEHVVGLDDGLGRGPGLERTKDQFQQDTALADAEDARRFLAEWDRNCQRLEIKHRHRLNPFGQRPSRIVLYGSPRPH
jgi:hypothetical protein